MKPSTAEAAELKRIRKKLGLTQEQLAEILPGVGKQYIYRWEARIHKIPPLLWLHLEILEQRFDNNNKKRKK